MREIFIDIEQTFVFLDTFQFKKINLMRISKIFYGLERNCFVRFIFFFLYI